MKTFLIIVGGIILFWILFGGAFSSRGDSCSGMTEMECEALSEVMGTKDRGY